MTEQQYADRLKAVMRKFIGRVINAELYADITSALSEHCDAVLCDELNNPHDRIAIGSVQADVVMDGMHYIVGIEGGRVVKP